MLTRTEEGKWNIATHSDFTVAIIDAVTQLKPRSEMWLSLLELIHQSLRKRLLEEFKSRQVPTEVFPTQIFDLLGIVQVTLFYSSKFEKFYIFKCKIEYVFVSVLHTRLVDIIIMSFWFTSFCFPMFKRFVYWTTRKWTIYHCFIFKTMISETLLFRTLCSFSPPLSQFWKEKLNKYMTINSESLLFTTCAK